MPNVDILLPGYSFATDSGLVAFCSVVLVESEGRRILVDTGRTAGDGWRWRRRSRSAT